MVRLDVVERAVLAVHQTAWMRRGRLRTAVVEGVGSALRLLSLLPGVPPGRHGEDARGPGLRGWEDHRGHETLPEGVEMALQLPILRMV